MKKVKKTRNKAFFGAILSGISSLIGGAISKKKQQEAEEEAERKRLEEEKRIAKLNADIKAGEQANKAQLLAQEFMQDEYGLAKYGKKIEISPSKRGTFTAAATKHGMNVQEFANEVLGNKDNYSPIMIKKATFAHNFAKKCGGKRVIKGKKNMYLS